MSKDIVYREDVYKAFEKEYTPGCSYGWVANIIKSVPSAEPRQQMARCIDQFDELYDEKIDAWQRGLDRFYRRCEELAKRARKNAPRGVMSRTEASERGNKEW